MSRSNQKVLCVLLGAVGLVLSLRYVLPYIGPFLVAVLLTALIDAPTNHLESYGLPRGASVLIVLGVIASVATGMIFLLTVNLSQDLMRLADQLPSIGQRLQELASAGILWANQVSAGLPLPLADAARSAVGKLTQGLETLIHGFLAALAGLPGLLASFAVAVLATFFLARDGRKLVRSFIKSLPLAWQKKTMTLNREIFAGVVGFMRAQVLLMLVSSLLSTVVLLLFRIPYAWLLGALAGVCDLLPVVGLSAVFGPLVAIQWLAGRSALTAGLAAAWGVVVILRQIVEPALVGSQIGLHPLTSLAAMYMGLQAWGVAGIFLGPLVATSAKALWLGALQPLLAERR